MFLDTPKESEEERKVGIHNWYTMCLDGCRVLLSIAMS